MCLHSVSCAYFCRINLSCDHDVETGMVRTTVHFCAVAGQMMVRGNVAREGAEGVNGAVRSMCCCAVAQAVTYDAGWRQYQKLYNDRLEQEL